MKILPQNVWLWLQWVVCCWNGREWSRVLGSSQCPRCFFQDMILFSSKSEPRSLYNHNNYFTISRTSTPILTQLQNDMKQNFFCNDDAGWGWGQPSSDCSENSFSSFMTCPLPPMSELTSRFNSILKIIPRKSFMVILCYCPLPPMSELTCRSRRW